MMYFSVSFVFLQRTFMFPFALQMLYSQSIRLPVWLAPIDLNQLIFNTLQIKFGMIKGRNTVSSSKISKRPLRPQSSGAYLRRNQRPSLQINQIITSLEKNVKELKNIYHTKEDLGRTGHSTQKSKHAFRTRKLLHRNSSQSNLQPAGIDKMEDKSLADVFQIRSFFKKVNGRETNNIIELFEFYKKNMEKRQKSTRILASMEMSNANMGISIEVGKESILKPESLYNKRDRETSKIEERLEEASRLQNTGKIQIKKSEKPSQLAHDLISKGYYNLTNVANLLNSKKYKLTRQKEESFRMHQFVKEKINHAKEGSKEMNNSKEINKENQKNTQNRSRVEEIERQQINALKQSLERITRNIPQQSFNPSNKSQISFKDPRRKLNNESISKNSFQMSSIHNSEKTSEKKPIQLQQSPPKPSKEQPSADKFKIDELSQLKESPIIKKAKQFTKSKYYVQPIPKKHLELQDEQSIPIVSDEYRLIDTDLLPFDL